MQRPLLGYVPTDVCAAPAELGLLYYTIVLLYIYIYIHIYIYIYILVLVLLLLALEARASLGSDEGCCTFEACFDDAAMMRFNMLCMCIVYIDMYVSVLFTYVSCYVCVLLCMCLVYVFK